MKLYFFRHGETPGNADYRYNGVTDEPLSELGIAKAKASGVREEIKHVYVTPLCRTQQTAKILFPNAAQTIVDGLREMDFGDFENRSPNEMAEDAAYRAWVDSWCEDQCPNGESKADFCQRVRTAFAELAPSLKDGDVFVLHGGTIMGLASGFAQPEMAYFDCSVKNCQGYAVDFFVEDGTIVFRNIKKLESCKEI